MLPDWLAEPGLAPLWNVLHDRLEQRGTDWRGRATVAVTSEDQRRALTALFGRPVRAGRLTVDAGALDELLTNAGGLVAVLTAAVGPVVDRRSARVQQQVARERPVTAARTRLGATGWAEEWLTFVRRLSPAPAQAVLAADLLRRLLQSHERVARQDLAAGVAGDAHALDDGTPLSSMVLRGLSLALGVPAPDHARARRELWDVAGVTLDSVSATALTLSLPGQQPGRPLHLTARDVDAVRPAGRVLVCENPRVLEALADHGTDLPVVCTQGNPNLVVLDVLTRLRSEGGVLLYHGDFDWPGLAMANRLVDSHDVRPWSMSADDYLAAVSGASLPLRGTLVRASWDEQLTEVMREHGVAVHEEAVLPVLLANVSR